MEKELVLNLLQYLMAYILAVHLYIVYSDDEIGLEAMIQDKNHLDLKHSNSDFVFLMVVVFA